SVCQPLKTLISEGSDTLPSVIFVSFFSAHGTSSDPALALKHPSGKTKPRPESTNLSENHRFSRYQTGVRLSYKRISAIHTLFMSETHL
ncbi:MAG: hypothetical protein CSH36_02385, partial [Thalassolituus sp.]